MDVTSVRRICPGTIQLKQKTRPMISRQPHKPPLTLEHTAHAAHASTQGILALDWVFCFYSSAVAVFERIFFVYMHRPSWSPVKEVPVPLQTDRTSSLLTASFFAYRSPHLSPVASWGSRMAPSDVSKKCLRTLTFCRHGWAAFSARRQRTEFQTVVLNSAAPPPAAR